MSAINYTELTVLLEKKIPDGQPKAPNHIKLVSQDLQSCPASGCAVFNGIVEKSKFDGKYGSIKIINYPREGVNNLILVGLGDLSELNPLKLQELGGDIFNKIALIKDETEFAISAFDQDDEALMQVVHGIQLKAWRFSKYISDKKKFPNRTITAMVSDLNNAENIKGYLDNILEGVSLTRELVSEPANIIYPESFVEHVSYLKDLGVKVTVLDKEQIITNNMNALMAVAQGSNKDPRVLVLEWNGHSGSSNFNLGVVGKGVTFDSGGIDLKGSNYLTNMKTDMSGAAVVVGLMQVLAKRKADVNVVGVCGLVENMPSGTAQKVGDIVKSMSGITIEVLNTDAEGRMVLADCLTYIQQRYSPKTVIDLATLTGACMVALGEEYAGLESNDDDVVNKLVNAANATGENLWRLPLCKHFEDAIASDFADIMNVSKPGTGGGSSTAAHFLKKFIQKNTTWAHLDIAGTAYRSASRKLHQKGATGFGVRLLNKFIEDNY